MSVLGSFLRRLLLQAVVSGTVMAGIQIALHFGPEVFPPMALPIITDHPVQPAPTQEASGSSMAARGAVLPFAQDRTDADVKAGRLPAWRVHDTTAAPLAAPRRASKDPGTGLSDVMLFDTCRPGCESRDPLLAFNQPGAARSVQTDPAPEPTDGLVVSSISAAPEAAANGSPAPRTGLLETAASGGAAMARHILGTAGRVVDW